MNSGTIAAFAAIFGSIVGALGSTVGTWITQRQQDRRDLLAKNIVRREALYSDFIAESARLLVDALEHNIGDPQKLIPAYALLSRIRLSSPQRDLDTAEELVRNILNTYAKPNLTPEQNTIPDGEWRRPVETVQQHLSFRAGVAAKTTMMDRGAVGCPATAKK